jgi:hypothetical protein
MIVEVPLRTAHTTWLVETWAHEGVPTARAVPVEMNFPQLAQANGRRLGDTGKNRSRHTRRCFMGRSSYLEIVSGTEQTGDYTTGAKSQSQGVGCQMNVHDSEKVFGTLVVDGYWQVETVEQVVDAR